MFFRSEPKWEVVEPLKDIGERPARLSHNRVLAILSLWIPRKLLYFLPAYYSKIQPLSFNTQWTSARAPSESLGRNNFENHCSSFISAFHWFQYGTLFSFCFVFAAFFHCTLSRINIINDCLAGSIELWIVLPKLACYLPMKSYVNCAKKKKNHASVNTSLFLWQDGG